MIAYDSKISRRVFGCLDSPSELVHELREVCRTRGISTGSLAASGIIRNARFLHWDESRKELQPELEPRNGPFVMVSATGFISQTDESGTDIQIYTLLTRPESGSNFEGGGLLQSADVIYAEYVIRSIDEVDFVRELDPQTGLPSWLNIRAGALSRSQGAPAGDQPGPSVPVISRATADEDLSAEEFVEEANLETGDTLDHPRLGRCEVVSAPTDERVKVRLDGGRIVDLHLGMVELTLTDPNANPKTYKVKMKRRNG